MCLGNVSFGIFIFHPFGWFLMLSVILIETVGLSYFLKKKIFVFEMLKISLLSNAISGIVGIAGSIAMNGGWRLIVWFPWVSSKELYGPSGLYWLAVFYPLAFVLSVLIESWLNCLMLRKKFGKREIIQSTFKVNVISYILVTAPLYYVIL